jgi:3',5'-cyclic AMP phosphodiesterase CpdA
MRKTTVATAIPGAALHHHLFSDRFRPFSHVVWARQADATVLLDAERGVYYTLNEVASRTWELLVAGEPVIEVLRYLGDEFDASDETLQADLSALLERLLDMKLIERIRP